MGRPPGEFDAVLVADYSGAASPAAQRRAIALWGADRGGRPRKVEGPFTRVRRLARAYRVPTLGSWRGDPVRLAERAMPGTKPATRLGGTGAVAGQTLVGLVELHRLLEDARRLGVRVLAWPMDALADDGESHVGCEIYPSFCRPRRVLQTDDADARWTCRWASRADLARALDLTGVPGPVREAARLEGWILGAVPAFGKERCDGEPQARPAGAEGRRAEGLHLAPGVFVR